MHILSLTTPIKPPLRQQLKGCNDLSNPKVQGITPLFVKKIPHILFFIVSILYFYMYIENIFKLTLLFDFIILFHVYVFCIREQIRFDFII